MERQEVAMLLCAICSAYPRFRFDNHDAAINVWTTMLQDLSAQEVTLAAQMLMQTSKFPPSIAEIREAVVKNACAERMTAGEAWAKVVKAIGLYGYYQPEKARGWLGDWLWGMIEQIGGWEHICTDDKLDVLSAQFERRYGQSMAQQIEQLQIAPALTSQAIQMRDKAEQLAGELSRLLEGEHGRGTT